jgi:hypothetical protein
MAYFIASGYSHFQGDLLHFFPYFFEHIRIIFICQYSCPACHSCFIRAIDSPNQANSMAIQHEDISAVPAITHNALLSGENLV